MKPRAVFRSLAVAACTLLLAGCSGGGEPEDELPDFPKQVAQAIAGAEAGGASEKQLAILHSAQGLGRVTFEQAREAILTEMECFTGGGGTSEYYEHKEPSGLIVPGLVATAEDDAALTALGPLMEECTTRESFWVNKLYQLQPDSQQARDEYLAKQAPVMRECLAKHGYAVDEDATPIEILQQVHQVDAETESSVSCYE